MNQFVKHVIVHILVGAFFVLVSPDHLTAAWQHSEFQVAAVDPEQDESEQWVKQIEPGIRRIGVIRPTAKYRCLEEPVVSPDAEYFLLHNQNSILQFDADTESPLNRCDFSPYESTRYFAISHDGDYIAVMGTVANSKGPATSEGDDAEVETTPPEPDGDPLEPFRKRLANNQVNRIQVFDRQLNRLASIDIHGNSLIVDNQQFQDSFHSIAFTFDQDELVVSGRTEALVIDWPSEQILQRLSLESKVPVKSFPVSPSEICLQRSDSDKLQLWNLRTGEVLNWKQIGQLKNAMLLDRSPDGSLLYFLSSQRRHLILDPAAEQVVELERSGDLEAVRICFSPDNQIFAGLFRDTKDHPDRLGLHFWNPVTGKLVRQQWLEGFDGWFTCRFIGDKNNKMLVSHRDGIHTVVQLDEPLEPQLLAAFQHMPLAAGLEFGNNDQDLAMQFSGILNIEAGVFDGRYRFPEVMSPTRPHYVYPLNPQKGVIQIGYRDYKANQTSTIFRHRVIDQDTVNLILKTIGAEASDLSMGGRCFNARYSPDGKSLFVVFQEYKTGLRFTTWYLTAKQLKLDSLAKVFPRLVDLEENRHSAIASDGSVYAVNDHGLIKVIGSEDGETIFETQSGTNAVLSLSEDGNQLAVGRNSKGSTASNWVQVFETETGKVLRDFQESPVHFGFASASGRFFLAPTDPMRPVQIFDIADWSEVLSHKAGDIPVSAERHCAAISSDGKTLAIALNDTRVEVWQLNKVGRNSSIVE